ncbi:dephospho-CoA kinase [Oceanicola sp. D3]|uniref:dephospho-CoA kinase n=1 Tax=Oceanicola sp. D3 TaxID=2587163 RepID=UPI0020C7A924|nr:dephospho-CoA kinase [Oceanicola sp. D3]
MGKSTTARMFADKGVAVWDADAAVHRLYDKGGAAVRAIAELRPAAVVGGSVSRAELRAWIAEDDGALQAIEAVVHPLVQQDRVAFADKAEADILLFDIPLLFETGAEREMDLTVTVSCSPEEQRRRVLERGTMDEAAFDRIVAAQMPDAEKRARADRVIETETLEQAEAQVEAIVAEIRERNDA